METLRRQAESHAHPDADMPFTHRHTPFLIDRLLDWVFAEANLEQRG
jgi:hypothetical protein